MMNMMVMVMICLMFQHVLSQDNAMKKTREPVSDSVLKHHQQTGIENAEQHLGIQSSVESCHTIIVVDLCYNFQEALFAHLHSRANDNQRIGEDGCNRFGSNSKGEKLSESEGEVSDLAAGGRFAFPLEKVLGKVMFEEFKAGVLNGGIDSES